MSKPFWEEMVEVGGKGQSAKDRRMRVGLYTRCGMVGLYTRCGIEAHHWFSVTAIGEADDSREA